MASTSYPSDVHNEGFVADFEFERLTHAQSPDGVRGTPADAPVVYADGSGTRQVRLRANIRALVRGFMWDSGSADVTLSLAANTSGLTRTDLIVLRLDRVTWTVREAVVQGTPGAGAPAYSQQVNLGTPWELPLASVAVANGATTLASGTVTPLAWYIADDGQTLCTPTTRPPKITDREIFETTTGRKLIATGAGTSGLWVVAAEPMTTVHISVPAGIDTNTRRAYRVNGQVSLVFAFKRTSAVPVGVSVQVGAIAPDYWPPEDWATPLIIPSATVQGHFCTITAGGIINATASANGQIPAGVTVIAAPASWPAPPVTQ